MGTKLKLTYIEDQEDSYIHGIGATSSDCEFTICSLAWFEECIEPEIFWAANPQISPGLISKAFIKRYKTNKPITCPACIRELEKSYFKKTSKGWI